MLLRLPQVSMSYQHEVGANPRPYHESDELMRLLDRDRKRVHQVLNSVFGQVDRYVGPNSREEVSFRSA